VANNTYKIPGKTTSEGFFSLVEKFLRIDQSLSQVIHVRFLPQIIFVCVISLFYIGNRHWAEKKIRNINQLETQVQDLRADYTTLKADYKFSSKQSEVAKQAQKLDLYESDVPPYKITSRE